MDERCRLSLHPHPDVMWSAGEIYIFVCILPFSCWPLGLVSVHWGFLLAHNTQIMNKNSLSARRRCNDCRLEEATAVSPPGSSVHCMLRACVCMFNLHNICFLHSFPAATNCWLSFVFDKRRRRERTRWEMELRQHRAKWCFFFFLHILQKNQQPEAHTHCQAVTRCLSAGLKGKIASPGCSSLGWGDGWGIRGYRGEGVALRVSDTRWSEWRFQGLQMAPMFKAKICVDPAVSFCPAEVGSQLLCRGLHFWHPTKPSQRNSWLSSGDVWPLCWFVTASVSGTQPKLGVTWPLRLRSFCGHNFVLY